MTSQNQITYDTVKCSAQNSSTTTRHDDTRHISLIDVILPSCYTQTHWSLLAVCCIVLFRCASAAVSTFKTWQVCCSTLLQHVLMYLPHRRAQKGLTSKSVDCYTAVLCRLFTHFCCCLDQRNLLSLQSANKYQLKVDCKVLFFQIISKCVGDYW